MKTPVTFGRHARGYSSRLSALALLLGAATLHSGQAPLPLGAQIRTVDLSERAVATVIPSEYDGGFFARIGDVLVNDSGIWVSDPGHKRVLWFDATGRLQSEFGREGNGPGEWMSPGIVSVDSILTVDDPQQGRQVRFRLDGSHKETRRVRHFADPDEGELPLWGAAPLRGGLTVGMIPASYRVSFSRAVAYDLNHHVVLLNSTEESADTLLSYHWGAAGWRTNVMGAVESTRFGAAGAWGVLDDTTVVLADGVTGTLSIVRAGPGAARVDSIDLGFAGRQVTERELDALEEVIREDASRDLPRQMEIDAPGHWSVATRLIPDGDQVLWLRQAVEGENPEWVVFNLATRDKWRVILPERFRLTAVHGGLLYGVTRDEMDLPSVGALVNPINVDLIPEPA